MGERRSCFSFLFFITRACFSHIFSPPLRGKNGIKKRRGWKLACPSRRHTLLPPDLHSQLGNICQLNCQLAKKEAGKNLFKIAKMKNSLCVYFWIFFALWGWERRCCPPRLPLPRKVPPPTPPLLLFQKVFGVSLRPRLSFWKHLLLAPPADPSSSSCLRNGLGN